MSPARKSAVKPTKRRAQRVLVIYKKSTYQLMVNERKNSRARALLERNDRAVARMIASHDDHVQTIQEARTLLERLGADATFRYRSDEGLTENFDLVITLGGDGTLLRASHLVGKRPMLAINTAPRDSVGYFCGGTRDDLEEVLVSALNGTLPGVQLTRMQIQLDGQVVARRVLNDMLFSHECPAATTRYLVKHGAVEEDQKSSGLWVGPAAGSTAAQRSAGGRVLPPSSEDLQYVVREPYMPNGTKYRLIRGLIKRDEVLTLTSKVHGAFLYVDGPHKRQRVEMGSEITLSRSPETLTVLGFRARKNHGKR
jgi:NAD+ kinase